MVLPKVAPITQIPLRHTTTTSKVEKKQLQAEDKAEYQKLIKNPPKKEIARDNLKSSKATIKSEVPKSNFSAEQH